MKIKNTVESRLNSLGSGGKDGAELKNNLPPYKQHAENEAKRRKEARHQKAGR
jgi:hypothetical protein